MIPYREAFPWYLIFIQFIELYIIVLPVIILYNYAVYTVFKGTV